VIDLSADMGEGAEGEEHIWPLITSANIACGGHYGDEQSMTRAAAAAREHGVRIGAHPSYPDRENFGRVSMTIAPTTLRSSIVSQINALRAVAPVTFVKPHGALYNDAHRDQILAGLIVEAMREVDPALALVCPSTSRMAAAARVAGTKVIREAFADRRYNPDGSLVSRKEPDALLGVDEAAEQAESLARSGEVTARDGTRIAVPFDTVCIHADMEHAVERIRAIRERIERL
jgi:UPF0271 protein